MKSNFKLYLIIILGFCLFIFQFSADRSLWLDEAKLAYSIVDRDFLDLLKPLDSGQMAPVLYLWCTKFFVLIFGDNDMALRIFPLFCSFLSIILVAKLGSLLLKEKTAILVLTALFCFCPTVIYYSSEIKQYTVDIMVFLLLLYCYFKNYKTETQRLITLSIVGVLAVTLSNVSIIGFFILGLYTLFFEFKKLKQLLIPFTIWILTFGVYYYVFLHQHPSRDLMQNYWEFAFMPINLFSVEFWSWHRDNLELIFIDLLAFKTRFYFFWIMILAYFFGIFSLLKDKNYKLLFIVLMPLFVHLALSALKLYPFYTRIILYQIPLYLLAITVGFQFIYKQLQKVILKKIAVLVFLIPTLSFAYSNFRNMPYYNEHIKPVYAFMNENVKPEEKIYVFSGNGDVFEYYKKIEFITFNNQIIPGEAHHYNYSGHEKQLNSLKGKIWFVFSHVYRTGKSGELESKYIIDYFKDKATIITKIEEGRNAAYLLDIK